jgi:hypothetical protein
MCPGMWNSLCGNLVSRWSECRVEEWSNRSWSCAEHAYCAVHLLGACGTALLTALHQSSWLHAKLATQLTHQPGWLVYTTAARSRYNSSLLLQQLSRHMPIMTDQSTTSDANATPGASFRSVHNSKIHSQPPSTTCPAHTCVQQIIITHGTSTASSCCRTIGSSSSIVSILLL